ncbi:MAG: hypothetical protein HDQ88_03260 [Clostridia bacterium]|nr:hypothetical protein [Clostridia bacterium]
MLRYVVTTTWSTGDCFAYQFDDVKDARKRLETEIEMYRNYLSTKYPYKYEIKRSLNKNATTFVIHHQNTTEYVMMSIAAVYEDNKIPLKHRLEKAKLYEPYEEPQGNDSDHDDDNQPSL